MAFKGTQNHGSIAPTPSGIARPKARNQRSASNSLMAPPNQVYYHPGIATGPSGLGNTDLNTVLKTLLGL